MELTQAIDILKTSATTKQKEVDALNLAVSVLGDKFAPELQVLENARQTITEKETVISQKTAEIEAISTEKTTLEARVQELEPLVESLKSEDGVKPVDKVTPSDVINTKSE